MVIRKQITSTGKNSSLKQIGVIAAVTTVKNMCKKSAVDSFANAQQDDQLRNYSQSRSVLFFICMSHLSAAVAWREKITKNFGFSHIFVWF